MKEPAKNDAISANLMISENPLECAHKVQFAKEYEMMSKKRNIFKIDIQN